MAKIIFVTGGCRSGKSNFARKLGEALPGPRTFLATCPILDGEMSRRIDKHRSERMNGEWVTIEETLEIENVLSNPNPNPILTRIFLLDCISLWVNNLLYEASQKGYGLEEADIENNCKDVISATIPFDYTLIIVSNEVGLGIVPDNAMARKYRDLLGRANQVFAEAANQVVFMVSGIPLYIKG